VADAAGKLPVGRLDLVQVPCLLETLAHVKQVRRQTAAPQVDAEALDQARADDDCAARFPERTAFANACLCLMPSGAVEDAGRGFDLAHDPSLGRAHCKGIVSNSDSRAGFY
jgi:hypothetical protein